MTKNKFMTKIHL